MNATIVAAQAPSIPTEDRTEGPRLGSRLSKQVCLRYVMRHPVAFREFWTPKVSRRGYWHRYTFSPVMLASATGDTSLPAGRGSGKSYGVLEQELVKCGVNRPGEETLLTSLRRIHIQDRMERAIDYFESVPFLKLFLKRILRSPAYMIELNNGHTIHGISVGDDPEAKMAQGKHASKLIVEESQQYPLRAWMKLQGAKDPRGCEILTAGVPDGRLDTPFRKADTVYDSFAGRRFRISRRMDPYFDQKTRKSFIDTLGPEDSDLFRQEVDAEWGNPVWSAWDLDAIYRCMEEKFPGETVALRLVLEISGKLYREQKLTPTVAIADLPGLSRSMPVRIAMDVGYSQPSEIGVFAFWNDRWWMIARIRLVNRMEHNDQAAVLMEIARRYEADRVGIDTTEGEGRAIAQELELGGWSGRIDRYSGNENILSGYTIERDAGGEPTGGIVELVEIMRSAATRRLREGFSKREYALPKDEDIAAEFNQEVEARSSDGVTRVLTPPTVHVSDMCRVFAIMQLIAAPPIPPQQDDSGAEVVLPEWGVGTGWRR